MEEQGEGRANACSSCIQEEKEEEKEGEEDVRHWKKGGGARRRKSSMWYRKKQGGAKEEKLRQGRKWRRDRKEHGRLASIRGCVGPSVRHAFIKNRKKCL